MSNNLYELLEVNPTASQEAISANFKRLHAKYSAALSTGDEDATNQLIALREAHIQLSDAELRRRYDNRLAARLAEMEVADQQSGPFRKLLLTAVIIGLCSIGYAKYQSDKEKTRLERERVVAERLATEAKMAELEARKEREERQLATQADHQRQREEAIERSNRERDIAYGNQVSRDLQRAEAQMHSQQQREEQQKANEERQRVADANRQLEKEKAYLRQRAAENARYRY